jgi:hypothetical protein
MKPTARLFDVSVKNNHFCFFFSEALPDKMRKIPETATKIVRVANTWVRCA